MKKMQQWHENRKYLLYISCGCGVFSYLFFHRFNFCYLTYVNGKLWVQIILFRVCVYVSGSEIDFVCLVSSIKCFGSLSWPFCLWPHAAPPSALWCIHASWYIYTSTTLFLATIPHFSSTLIILALSLYLPPAFFLSISSTDLSHQAFLGDLFL